MNDSKGTNVDSTEKALEAFPGRKIILILGGDDAKKSDFSPLLPLLKKECRAIVLLKKTTPQIKKQNNEGEQKRKSKYQSTLIPSSKSIQM